MYKWVCGNENVDRGDKYVEKKGGKIEMWKMCIMSKTVSTCKKALKNKDFWKNIGKECVYIAELIHILSTICG